MDDVEHPHQMLPAATNVTNQSPQIKFLFLSFHNALLMLWLDIKTNPLV